MKLIWMVVMAVAAPALAGTTFTVAPNGRDTWEGSRQRPFASVPRALAAARQWRTNHSEATGPVRISLRGGTYWLTETIALTPEDSGTKAAPLVIEGSRGETPVLSGGQRVTGWKTLPNGNWTVHLPNVKDGTWNFQSLFVNGSRRARPRLPRAGFFHVAGALEPSPQNRDKGFDRFIYAEGNQFTQWRNRADLEILTFQPWAMYRWRIKEVDSAHRIVAFTGTTPGLSDWARLREGTRYLVENVGEALQQPGEWYLDRPNGNLTYVPRPGERWETSEIVAPRVSDLLRLHGDAGRSRWVEHVQIRGLTFRHDNWVTPPDGNAFPQAEVNLPAAITLVGARNCVVADTRVEGTGAWAVDIGQASQHCSVLRSVLKDLGAGGVKIGEMVYRDDPDQVTSHNVLRDCVIAHGGRMHPAGTGVWIGHSPHNVIDHNTIFDLYYTGISVGWSWGYGRSLAHHNTIAWNHIHTIGQGLLSDMGGIYTLGRSPGSVLHHNRIHDIGSHSYGGWGIYFDEGTTGMLARDNVVYRAKTGGFHQHYGRENRLENNIFALGQTGQLIRTRAEEHLSFTFEGNIVYWNEGPLLGSNWSGHQFRLDRNLYWNADGKPVDFDGNTLEQWQALGQDKSSLIADPLFVDPDAGDFRLRPGSPAEKIGFRALDLRSAGARSRNSGGDAAWPPAFPRITDLPAQ